MPLITECDLLVQELSPAQRKWEDIGRELGVKQDTLSKIRTNYSDSGDCLRMVFSERLEKRCITWKSIITILRIPCVGESNLAYQLEAKHCPSEHSSMIVIMEQCIIIELEVHFKPYLYVDYKYKAGNLKKYINTTSINVLLKINYLSYKLV